MSAPAPELRTLWRLGATAARALERLEMAETLAHALGRELPAEALLSDDAVAPLLRGLDLGSLARATDLLSADDAGAPPGRQSERAASSMGTDLRDGEPRLDRTIVFPAAAATERGSTTAPPVPVLRTHTEAPSVGRGERPTRERPTTDLVDAILARHAGPAPVNGAMGELAGRRTKDRAKDRWLARPANAATASTSDAPAPVAREDASQMITGCALRAGATSRPVKIDAAPVAARLFIETPAAQRASTERPASTPNPRAPAASAPAFSSLDRAIDRLETRQRAAALAPPAPPSAAPGPQLGAPQPTGLRRLAALAGTPATPETREEPLFRLDRAAAAVDEAAHDADLTTRLERILSRQARRHGIDLGRRPT